ncbi:chitooligosaccharidolytic beta-N-acetylglucosaminidase-like isoform X2 [Neocloeon triangulifer]|nr:chitooligosaccharidolytic beta-N-acetylglucosaminidase-like isoform X2 [Neocloeon triangulifer]
MASLLLMVSILAFGCQKAVEATTLVVSGEVSEKTHDPPWVWRCTFGNCVRLSANSSVPTIGTTYHTQDECSLMCGRPLGPLWPRPNGQVRLGHLLLVIDVTTITFLPTPYSKSTALLSQMEGVFREEVSLLACNELSCLVCDRPANYRSLLLKVQINLDYPNIDHLEWNTDESYSLNINSDAADRGSVTAQISAATVFGARHGLETLAQLMTKGEHGSGYLYLLSDAEVLADKPKFTHRGITLDTSRHFIPLPAIKRTLDIMSTCKLNVLHLHLTDSHSFPFVSEAVPEMSEWGAYSDQETYTIEQLVELSNYALVRGIRIIPELDAPAHAGQGWQWGRSKGKGELAVCVNQQPWRELCIQPPCGQLHPGNDNVYAILGQLYKEFKDTFAPHANSVFHMGGDEVFLECWKATYTVSDWLATQRTHGQLTDEDFMWAWKYFQSKALQELDKAYNHSSPDVILWSSHLTDTNTIMSTLDPHRYVIQTWVPENETLPQDLINLGYRVIVSTKDAWYLDHGFWGQTKYANWKRVYNAKLPQGALGGEVALWSELIDELTMDSILWPRAAALAERLWSNPSSISGAENRLLRWRRRIVGTRGIKAATVTPGWCEMHEGQCD